MQVGSTACEFGGSHFAKVHEMRLASDSSCARRRRTHPLPALASGAALRACRSVSRPQRRRTGCCPRRDGNRRPPRPVDRHAARPRPGVGAVQRIVEPVRLRGRRRRRRVARRAISASRSLSSAPSPTQRPSLCPGNAADLARPTRRRVRSTNNEPADRTRAGRRGHQPRSRRCVRPRPRRRRSADHAARRN